MVGSLGTLDQVWPPGRTHPGATATSNAPENPVLGRSPIQALFQPLGSLTMEFSWDPGEGPGLSHPLACMYFLVVGRSG